MSPEELERYSLDLADQCVKDIERYWHVTPNVRHIDAVQQAEYSVLEREKLSWRTSVRYYIARAVALGEHIND